MSEDPEKLVLLTTAGPLDASLIRTSLEGAGIRVELRGENIATIDPRMGLISGVEVHVAARDVEAAQALLSDREGPRVETIEGAVCAVHEQPATAKCDRCGTFLCAQCSAFGDPPLCDDCIAHQDEAIVPPRSRAGTKVVAALLLAPFAIGLLALIALAAARLFGWLS